MKIYIYGLYDPRDGALRYVGKTAFLKVRLADHIIKARRQRFSDKSRWILGLLEQGLVPRLEVLEETDEDGWQELEKRWISVSRIKGAQLLNVAEGGGGPPDWAGRKQSTDHVRRRVEARRRKGNYWHSSETKKRISLAKKGTQAGDKNPFYGKKHSEESLRKQSEAHRGQPAWNKGMPCPEEIRQIISKAKQGTKASEETRKKMSATRKGRKMSPEFSEKLRQANLGKHHSEETKEKLRRANLGKQHSEETKEKLRELFTGRFVSEETRQKMSQSRKGKKMTPEQLAKRKEAQQRLWQDPEYRARMLEAQRRRREREAEEKAESQTNP